MLTFQKSKLTAKESDMQDIRLSRVDYARGKFQWIVSYVIHVEGKNKYVRVEHEFKNRDKAVDMKTLLEDHRESSVMYPVQYDYDTEKYTEVK